jgi:transketolase
VAVASLGGVKPLDTVFLEAMTKRFQRWISLEEHGIIGGLGSALLEWLAEREGTQISLKRLGVPDAFLHELGNQNYARCQLGLDAEGLAQTIRHEFVV